jgi:methylthioribose-1-phosphate isomerase
MNLPLTIEWTPDGIRTLDQALLPGEERYELHTAVESLAEAIVQLRIRGAPLLGVAGAMGVALAASRGVRSESREDLLRQVEAAGAMLVATRPTAVNLRWAVDRMLEMARRSTGDASRLTGALVVEALAIQSDDRAMCDQIGAHGMDLVPDGALVMTHCNAGALATAGIGTALAPVYAAVRAGRRVHVVVNETRPVLQGSRLTAWELGRAGVERTLIADNMAASRLRVGDVTCVLVGADRIAANGDTANKIGTYGLALAAHAHGVPFYVAAPRSTFDPATADGGAIPIEQRPAQEVTHHGGHAMAPADVAVWNPAFDVTPAHLITGFITDAGRLAPADLRAHLDPEHNARRTRRDAATA